MYIYIFINANICQHWLFQLPGRLELQLGAQCLVVGFASPFHLCQAQGHVARRLFDMQKRNVRFVGLPPANGL